VTILKYQLLCGVLLDCDRLAERHHGKVTKPCFIDNSPWNFKQPAAQQALVMRYSVCPGDRLEAPKEVTRIVSAFFAVGGEDTADTNAICVQADRRLNVHFKCDR
jgi:hypothetical protein